MKDLLKELEVLGPIEMTIAWMITVTICYILAIVSIIKNKEEISLYEIVGGALAIAILCPLIWVFLPIILLSEIKFYKKD